MASDADVTATSPPLAPNAVAVGAGAYPLVVIVEDDPRTARVLCACLSADGYRVALVADGEQLNQLISKELPALIVCDVLLPGIDGIEITRGLRSREETRSLPVLLVTSLDDRKVLSRGLGAGANDILIKPIHPLELRTRIAALLRKNEMTAERHGASAAASFFHETDMGTCDDAPAPAAKVDEQSPDCVQSTVLIVEDDEVQFRLLSSHLAELNCRILRADNVEAAQRSLNAKSVDICVLDLLLGERSGYDLIECMRQDSRHGKTPILIVSAISDIQARVKALELGADDFILKGCDRLELQARVRRLLRLNVAMTQLTIGYDQALKKATIDTLTGLSTRGCFQDTLQREFESARRYASPLSLIFLDLDHFKTINDEHGHAVGDEVLRKLGATIRDTVRHADIAARYGGEEFVVLMPHADRCEAGQLAERVRCAVAEQSSFRAVAVGKVNVTISLGVASYPEDAADAVTLLQHADEAMYKAKRDGRNRVTIYSAPQTRNSGQATVLIADDEERNLRLLEAYLVADGYRTIRARDGSEALELARRERPDLIVLDGMMPQMSGFDACRAIKEDCDLRLTPVVLVTALNGRDDKLRGIESGADDFLSKPIDKVALLMRMRSLLRTKRTTDLLEDAETVIFALARAVEGRDPSTGGHVERVSHYAAALGREAGLSDSHVEGLRRAGVVHDIGKIVIPDRVLLKPGELTAEERQLVQNHVEAGYELLRPMRTFTDSLPAVRFHHERLNGSGYPLGLRGDQIPITAQILAIVDVFDSLTTDRVYRSALPVEEALNILDDEASRGLHDPRLVELLAGMVMKAPETASTAAVLV